jgi:hypothetical protein
MFYHSGPELLARVLKEQFCEHVWTQQIRLIVAFCGNTVTRISGPEKIAISEIVRISATRGRC